MIVIVVIGILSGMMMLSSAEAVSSAKASNIISNLRNLKTATLAWYADNFDRVNSQGNVELNSDKTALRDQNVKGKMIQECTDSELGLSKYLNSDRNLKINSRKEPSNKAETKGDIARCQKI